MLCDGCILITRDRISMKNSFSFPLNKLIDCFVFFYSINASSCELCEAYSDKMEKHFGRFIIFVSAPLNLPNIFINQFDLSTNTQNSSRVTSLKAMGQAKFEYPFEFLFLVFA